MNVTVLLETGHRIKVKTHPQMSILQILEDVCAKRNLNADVYDLKHHKRVLDPSTMIEFSGIPNNAQLELVPAEKGRSEKAVNIHLQLEMGQRIVGSFPPTVTVWEVMDALCAEDEKLKENPVVVYLRREISGLNLKTTTLKTLGLTSGSALLRLLHRTPQQIYSQAVSGSGTLKRKSDDEAENPSPKEAKIGTNTEENDDRKFEMCNFNECKVEKDAEIGGMGTVPRDEICAIENSSLEINTDLCAMETNTTPLDLTVEPSPETHCYFSEIEEPSAETYPASEIRDLKPAVDINGVEYIGERHALLYSAEGPAITECAPLDDNLDSFYTLSIQDAKLILRDLTENCKKFDTENKDFSSLAAREQEKVEAMRRKISLYPTTVVRVHFPNRVILQGIFETTECISDIMAFVRNFLADSGLDFQLYTTPPKTVLNPEEKIVNLDGVAGSLKVYFNTTICSGTSLGVILKEELAGKLCEHRIATAVHRHFRGLENKGQTCDSTDTSSSSSSKGEFLNDTRGPSTFADSSKPSTYTSANASASTSTVGKVPKWFKAIKK